MLPIDRLIRPFELAEVLGMSEQAVRRNARKGYLPRYDVKVTIRFSGWFPSTIKNWNPGVYELLVSRLSKVEDSENAVGR